MWNRPYDTPRPGGEKYPAHSIMELKIDCPPSYPPGCKVVFVGEAPGEEEQRAREGFVGAAGKVLQKACGVAGLEWARCGRSNVAKRRPPGNRFKEAFYETIEEPIYTKTGKLSKKTRKVVRKTDELQEWEESLRRELLQHKPNLVVACGNESLEAVTGITGITNYRGSILGSKWEASGGVLKVLAVEHPSYILRGQFLDFWILCRDLGKAKREMEFPEIRREPYEAISNPQKDLFKITDSLGLLERFRNARWTLDVETRAGTLACFAIAYQIPGEVPYSICIPLQTTTGPYWSPGEELRIWRALHDTAKNNPNLCNQNIEYDLYYLLQHGVEPAGVYMDTMLAHSLLYPEFPKSLDFLASIYLDDVVYWKQDHRDWTSRTPDEALWEYNCKDAVYTLRIVEEIDKELKKKGLWEFYHGKNFR